MLTFYFYDVYLYYVDEIDGTGQLVDAIKTTGYNDMVINNGSTGITVDLGGSKSGADVFDGSVASKNDVLDARSVQDLTFEEDGDYIKVTNGTDVNALLKDVDYIMVRDRAQGPEVTQADIKAYDDETERLQDLKEAADIQSAAVAIPLAIGFTPLSAI